MRSASGSTLRLSPHQVLLFFLALSALWETLFSTWFDAVPDLIELQYPVNAATMLQLSKWLEIDGSSSSGFSSKRISGSSAPEICFVAVVTVLTGIGAWAVLVLVEAKFIGASSAYHSWGLINAARFHAVRWGPSRIVIDLIVVALMAPIYEEIAFRGLLLGILLKKYSPVKAILFGSVIFAIFHLHRSFLGSFLHAILFSIVAIRLSSLYASMIVHGIFNLCVDVLRFTSGVSLVADMAQIDKLSYWRFELLLMAIGLLLGSAYVYLSLKTVPNPAVNVQTSPGDTDG